MKDETLLSPELLLQAYRAGVFPMSAASSRLTASTSHAALRNICAAAGFMRRQTPLSPKLSAPARTVTRRGSMKQSSDCTHSYTVKDTHIPSKFGRITNWLAAFMALQLVVQRQGYTLFDTQFLTPHLATLGAIEIPREDYHKKLIDALPRTVSFGDRGAMQLMTTQCNAAPKHRIADDPAHEARAPKQSTSP